MKKTIDYEKEGFYREVVELEKGERINIMARSIAYDDLVFTSSEEGLKLTFTFNKDGILLNTIIRKKDIHVGLIAFGDYYIVEKEGGKE